MLTVLYVSLSAAVVLILGFGGFFSRPYPYTGKHRSWSSCRCGHLILAHAPLQDEQSCDLCDCAQFRGVR